MMKTGLAICLAIVTTSLCAEEWRSLPPAFKAKDEKLSPTVGFHPIEGKVTLRNRGSLVSVQETQDFELSFDWRFTAGQDEGSYQDVLSVAFATDGNLGSKWSFEPETGFVLAVQAHAGEVTLDWKLPGKGERLAGAKMKFERNTDYKVYVSRSGLSVSVKIDDKELFKATLPEEASKVGKILIFNREPVAGVEQISVLGKLSLNLP